MDGVILCKWRKYNTECEPAPQKLSNSTISRFQGVAVVLYPFICAGAISRWPGQL